MELRDYLLNNLKGKEFRMTFRDTDTCGKVKEWLIAERGLNEELFKSHYNKNGCYEPPKISFVNARYDRKTVNVYYNGIYLFEYVITRKQGEWKKGWNGWGYDWVIDNINVLNLPVDFTAEMEKNDSVLYKREQEKNEEEKNKIEIAKQLYRVCGDMNELTKVCEYIVENKYDSKLRNTLEQPD